MCFMEKGGVQCSGFTLGLCTQGSHLAGLKGPYGVLETESRFDVCKISTLPAVLLFYHMLGAFYS